eukprot:8263840-Pyramimonas_sp.AAC.1
MTSTGTQYFGGLLSGGYQLLSVARPAGWPARLPGKRAGPHVQRIQNVWSKLGPCVCSSCFWDLQVTFGDWDPCVMRLKTSACKSCECDVVTLVLRATFRVVCRVFRACSWQRHARVFQPIRGNSRA